MSRFARKIQKLLFREQWSLLISDAEGHILKAIAPARDRMWADPFIVQHGGKTYVFVEQQINGRNGTLGFLELNKDHSPSDFNEILAADHHLSFPNVFPVATGDRTVWYMIPESNERGSIDLYRATSFPDRWVFDSTLISGVNAVDSSAFFHDNRWYLFTSIEADGHGFNNSLSVFYSDTFPSSNWKSHPLNPVCTGSGNSRMAGALYRDPMTGYIIRPAQSCTREYGEYTVLNRVTELSPQAYREERISVIRPEGELHAVCTHTFNRSGSLIARDIKTRIFRFAFLDTKKRAEENA